MKMSKIVGKSATDYLNDLDEPDFDELSEYRRISAEAKTYPAEAYWELMFALGKDSPMVERDKLLLFNLNCYINSKLAYHLREIMDKRFISITHSQAAEFLRTLIPETP